MDQQKIMDKLTKLSIIRKVSSAATFTQWPTVVLQQKIPWSQKSI